MSNDRITFPAVPTKDGAKSIDIVRVRQTTLDTGDSSLITDACVFLSIDGRSAKLNMLGLARFAAMINELHTEIILDAREALRIARAGTPVAPGWKLPPSIARSPGEVIRRLRVLSGLSQKQLAKKSGISASAIHGLEQDQRSPTPSTLAKLAAAMNTTTEDMLVAIEKVKESA
jgi:DNA-binding XRE family transcriptional regulator